MHRGIIAAGLALDEGGSCDTSQSQRERSVSTSAMIVDHTWDYRGVFAFRISPISPDI
jgi:hypothetical protein